MGDTKYESNGINNNSSSTSSPSKPKVRSDKIGQTKVNETRLKNGDAEKKIPQSKSNVTPTKKSVTNSILSFTSSILAAAAASATKDELSSSPEQSPSRERRRVIDLSSSHASPLKRASTPSASPTRRGGRATKPSPHQGTPPQSPPTPHKIICQATVETIEPSVETTSDKVAKATEQRCIDRNRSSPIKKGAPGSKLISSPSPKKTNLPVDRELSTTQRKETVSSSNSDDSNPTVTNGDKLSNLSARRNLTNSFLTSNTCEQNGQSNDADATKPKKR